jgi:hypothetical protein
MIDHWMGREGAKGMGIDRAIAQVKELLRHGLAHAQALAGRDDDRDDGQAGRQVDHGKQPEGQAAHPDDTTPMLVRAKGRRRSQGPSHAW